MKCQIGGYTLRIVTVSDFVKILCYCPNFVYVFDVLICAPRRSSQISLKTDVKINSNKTPEIIVSTVCSLVE